MTHGRSAGVAAILITSVLWGTTGTSATFAPEVGPLAIGAAALGIGGLLQAVIAVGALRCAMPLLRARWRLVLVGALAVAIYPLAFYSAMRLSGVAIGTVVSLASAPIISGLLEWVTQRRPLSGWWVLAATLGIAGSVLLCLSRSGGATSNASLGLEAFGILLGLVAGATYSVYSWAAHRLMQDGVSRGASMGAVFGIGGALLMPVLVVTGAPILSSTHAVVVAGYMALIPMFLGYLMFGFGLARVPASTATTLTLAEPAVAAVLAVLLVGETLGAVGWIGLGIIASVLVILAVAPTNAPQPAHRFGPTRTEIQEPQGIS